MNMLLRLIRSFIRRLSTGDFRNTAYLTWYFCYLYTFDLRNQTCFANSHPPSSSYGTNGGTGNFPGHPRVVKFLLKASSLPTDTAIIDVGHGSGVALFAAAQLGFTNLTGVEHEAIPYNMSVRNLKGKAQLIFADAFSIDLSGFKAIFFFNSFGGILAQRFFANLPNSITHVITMNLDPTVEPLLIRQQFEPVTHYNHRIYANFRGTVWKR